MNNMPTPYLLLLSWYVTGALVFLYASWRQGYTTPSKIQEGVKSRFCDGGVKDPSLGAVILAILFLVTVWPTIQWSPKKEEKKEEGPMLKLMMDMHRTHPPFPAELMLSKDELKEPILVITHGSCMDGLGAAWALSLFLPAHAEFVEGHYGNPPADVEGKIVIMTDFSYKRAVLEDLAHKAKRLIVLDHHDSAEKDLEGLPYAYFDQTRSGARLAWDYVSQMRDMPIFLVPPVLAYIEDRDIWKWEMYKSREVNEVLSHPRFGIDHEAGLNDRMLRLADINNSWDLDTIVELGEGLVEDKEAVLTLALNGAFLVTVDLGDGNGGPICFPVCFGDKRTASEAGNTMAGWSLFPEEDPGYPEKYGVALVIGGMHYGKFAASFRGIYGDMAQKLAIHFGGGGHQKAAGAGLTTEQLTTILSTAYPLPEHLRKKR